MKYMVLTNYIDKYTEKTVVKGTTLELNEQRANEIFKKGKFIQLIEEKVAEETTTKKTTAKKTTK